MKYFYFEVLLPLWLVVLAYSSSALMSLWDEPHAFEKIFATGDLWMISVFILVNSYVVLERAGSDEELTLNEAAKLLCFFSGVVIVTTCIFLKADALHFDYSAQPISSHITKCAWASIGCLFYSALLNAFARFISTRARAGSQRDVSYLTSP
jgi:hypothetical protein